MATDLLGCCGTSPKVSVLIPVRNARDTVELAVRSILNQDFSDLELVIVDDGSADGTIDVLTALAKEDSRVRIKSTEPLGIIDALNTGINLCRGEYLARMDADDVSHPARIRLQLEMMEQDMTLSVCGCLVRFFPRKTLLGGFAKYEEWLNSLISHEEVTRDIFVESPMPHPGVMLRINELRQLGGYEEHGWPEDYDLWLRYYIAGKRFGKVARKLIFQRDHPQRLTTCDCRYSVESFLRAKAHYLSKKLLPSHGRIILWGAGANGRRLSKHLIREGLKIEAVVDVDDKKIGRTMRNLPIFPPEYIETSKTFIISAVSSHEARGLIREQLTSLGKVEGEDFICAA